MSSPFGNLSLKTAIGADSSGKPPLRCSLLMHSSLTPLPGQWDRHQSCKYSLGATFVITSHNFFITRHKSFGCATLARHNIKHVLWHAIAARMALLTARPGIDISEGIDINKTSVSKKCDTCHYWYFLSKNFSYQLYLCNGCHDLMQKAMILMILPLFLLEEVITEFTFGIWVNMMQLAWWIILI